MQSRFLRFAAFSLAVIFVVGLCLTDADAQSAAATYAPRASPGGYQS